MANQPPPNTMQKELPNMINHVNCNLIVHYFNYFLSLNLRLLKNSSVHYENFYFHFSVGFKDNQLKEK